MVCKKKLNYVAKVMKKKDPYYTYNFHHKSNFQFGRIYFFNVIFISFVVQLTINYR